MQSLNWKHIAIFMKKISFYLSILFIICLFKITSFASMNFNVELPKNSNIIKISGQVGDFGNLAPKLNVLIRYDNQIKITPTNVESVVLCASEISVNQDGSFYAQYTLKSPSESTTLLVTVNDNNNTVVSKQVVWEISTVDVTNMKYWRISDGRRVYVNQDEAVGYSFDIKNNNNFNDVVYLFLTKYQGDAIISCEETQITLAPYENKTISAEVAGGFNFKLMFWDYNMTPIVPSNSFNSTYVGNEFILNKVFLESDVVGETFGNCTSGYYKAFEPICGEVKVKCKIIGENNISFLNYEGVEVVRYNIVPQQLANQYEIQFVLDTNLDLYDVYINGVIIDNDKAFDRKTDNISRIAFNSISGVSYLNVAVCDVGVDSTISYQNAVISSNDAPAPNGIVYQGENMQLFNYIISNNPNAVNSQSVRVSSRGTGQAKFNFQHNSGYYTVKTAYIENNNAVDSMYRIFLNDKQVDYWYSKYDDGKRHIRNNYDVIYIDKGDLITIEGYYGGDFSEFDYVEFVGVTKPIKTSGTYVDEAYWAVEQHKASSWDIYEDGGTVRTTFNVDRNVLRFNDTSDNKNVCGIRKVAPVSLLGLCLEGVLSVNDKNDGCEIQLRSGEIPVATIVFSNGGIYYRNKDDALINIVSSYSKDVWNYFTVKFDNQGQLCNISFNNALRKNIEKQNNQNYIDNIFIKTGIYETSTLNISTIRLYNGYCINDSFNTVPTEGITSGWQTTGNVAVRKIPGDFVTDNNSLILSSVSKVTKATQNFVAKNNQLTTEFNFLIKNSNDESSIILDNTTLRINQSTLCCGTDILWDNLKNNMWYNVKIEFNGKKRKIYVNKILKLEQDYNFNSGAKKIEFNTLGSLWIDDVVVVDSVHIPKIAPPVAISTGKYDVGVQACDLWKDGKHFGWDSIKPYDNRIPLNGFYDDGDIDVAEQEIKWMTENGIKVYIPCWYRPNVGDIIKNPLHSSKLHDAMLETKFMDNMKFMISYENSAGVANAQDFKENVVNYWIERYFKHPSYYVIDNKPVIAVWNPFKLSNDLGGIETNKAVFKEIEQMLIAEGFSGVIWIGKYFGDAQNTQKIKDMGYDYTYIYGFGATDMNKQIDYHNTQKNMKILDAITSVSQGWGDEPWGFSQRKYNIGFEDYKNGLRYLKQNYMNGYSQNSLASKLLMLGNWNEIGEGHMLVPANFSGFGYLNAIKEVFLQ